jgi:hypothetical protein
MTEKRKLTTEQFIKDMEEMDPAMGDWANYLVNDCKMSSEECLSALQRMVDYVKDKSK